MAGEYWYLGDYSNTKHTFLGYNDHIYRSSESSIINPDYLIMFESIM